jgi:hypothetical protein
MYDPNTGQDDGTDPIPGTIGGGGFTNTANTPITRDVVLSLYHQFIPGYEPSESEIQSHLGHPGGAQALTQFFQQYAADHGTDANLHPINGTPTPPPPPPGGGGGTPGLGAFQPPASQWDFNGWANGAPGFAPPGYTPPPAFVEPDYNTVVGQDPGYQFELKAGLDSREHSAAARGVLNGGGTIAGNDAWAQNYAATRVNDARNRAKDTYLTNYATQYTDPYKYAYQAALDAFTGRNSQWQTQGQVGQRQNEVDWQHAYTPWNDTWNRAVQVGLQ